MGNQGGNAGNWGGNIGNVGNARNQGRNAGNQRIFLFIALTKILVRKRSISPSSFYGQLPYY